MKQFNERNPILIGLIALGLIVASTVIALTLQRDDLTGGYRLTLEFTEANGLRTGDLVEIAGVRAGTVVEVAIVRDHVEAVAQMSGGVEVPATTRAQVKLRTLVGTRAIDLDTGDDFTRLLEDGDRIPIGQTRVAIDVPTFAEDAEDLLSEIDSEALNTFLVSLTDLTRDQRDEVAQLVDSGGRLADLVTTQEQQLRLLLRQLAEVSRTLNSRDDELIGIIDDLDVALASVAARRGDLTRLFEQTRRAGADTADLIAATRADLDSILTELHVDLAIVNRHQVDIAEALAYSGDAIEGFASIAFAGDIPVDWGHVFVTSAGPIGIDVLAGCDGLIDQQLDLVLGEDPRPCSEQDGSSTPGDVPPADPLVPPILPDLPPLPPIPPIPGLPPLLPSGDGPVAVVQPAAGIDAGPRGLLDRLLADTEAAP